MQNDVRLFFTDPGLDRFAAGVIALLALIGLCTVVRAVFGF